MTQYDQRITAYFGDAVLQAGFMPLPHLLLRHYRQLEMSQVHLVFVLQLMEIAWDITNPPITVAKLAERMDVTERAIRKWSQELMEGGLIRIYDQYDRRGTQVENAYDLSPLFHRLAALAPVKPPVGELRQRRSRAGNHDHDALQEEENTPATVATSTQPDAPSRNSHSPSSRNSGSSSDGMIVPSSPEQSFSGQGNDGTGLKEEPKKEIKKQPRRSKEQQQHGESDRRPVVAVRQGRAETGRSEAQNAAAGRSLRWDRSLNDIEVQQSSDVLLSSGLNAPVARAVANSLHPAEAWALCCYARSAKLGPAWVASQVYDFSRHQPQEAGLSRRYDTVGHLLAVLPLEVAEAVLDAADQHCPHDLAGAHATLPADEDVQDALTAVWSVMAEQRSQRSHGDSHQPTLVVQLSGRSLPFSELRLVPAAELAERTVLLPQADATSRAILLPELWDITLREVQPRVTQSEWDTWLRSTVLLDVDDSEAIIGTPNIFVRQEVEQHYAELLQSALQAALCRQMHINVVIAGGAR